MDTLWPAGADMMSKEVVLSMRVRSHKTDPVQVWIYQTMTALRTKRVGSRSEGQAADVATVLKDLGWEWDSALEIRTKDGEKLHIVQSSGGHWRHRIREGARNWRLRHSKTRQAARNLDTVEIQRPLRGNTLTSIQRGQLRAILAGAIQSCARMLARARMTTGLCPACVYEDEDLAHLRWGCRAEHCAPIPEKASPLVNIELVRPAHRDMLFVQHDVQL